ncbi:MAG: hypothetical protein ACOC9R_01740 [bacterium]
MVNGTPQPDRHRNLGGRKTSKAAAAGGASSGGSCAAVPFPLLDRTLVDALAGAVAVGLVVLAMLGALALYAHRRDRRPRRGRYRAT